MFCRMNAFNKWLALFLSKDGSINWEDVPKAQLVDFGEGAVVFWSPAAISWMPVMIITREAGHLSWLGIYIRQNIQFEFLSGGVAAYMKKRLGNPHDFLGLVEVPLYGLDIVSDGGEGLGSKGIDGRIGDV